MSLPKPSEMRKGIVGFLGFASITLTLALAQGDLIPESAVKWVTFAIAAIGAFLNFHIPNDRAPGTTQAEAAGMSVRESPGAGYGLIELVVGVLLVLILVFVLLRIA